MYCDRQGDEVFVYGQEEFADWMSRQQRLDRACQEIKWRTKEINSRKPLNVSSLSQSQLRLPQATASSACRDEMDWQASSCARCEQRNDFKGGGFRHKLEHHTELPVLI